MKGEFLSQVRNLLVVTVCGSGADSSRSWRAEIEVLMYSLLGPVTESVYGCGTAANRDGYARKSIQTAKREYFVGFWIFLQAGSSSRRPGFGEVGKYSGEDGGVTPVMPGHLRPRGPTHYYVLLYLPKKG